jgi:hypothetical protein
VHVTVVPLIALCGTTAKLCTCGPVAVVAVLVAVTVLVAAAEVAAATDGVLGRVDVPTGTRGPGMSN